VPAERPTDHKFEIPATYCSLPLALNRDHLGATCLIALCNYQSMDLSADICPRITA
jgi:hypothetical protein